MSNGTDSICKIKQSLHVTINSNASGFESAVAPDQSEYLRLYATKHTGIESKPQFLFYFIKNCKYSQMPCDKDMPGIDHS